MVVVLAVAGIVLLILAGLNVRGPRFAPEWWGLSCLAAAWAAPAFAVD